LLYACNEQPAENNDDTKKEHSKELFSLLDASATNINFQNTLTEV